MRRDADTRRIGDVRHLREFSIREVTYTSRFHCKIQAFLKLTLEKLKKTHTFYRMIKIVV